MNKLALTALSLVAVVCLAAAGSGARTRTSSSPVSGQAISPSSVVSPLGTFDVVDAGVALINGQLQVLGPVAGSSTITGTTLIGSNSNTSSQLRLFDSTDTKTWYFINNNDTIEQYNNATAKISTIGNDGVWRNTVSVGTAASGTGVTAVYSGAVRHFVHKVTVINTALAAAGTSDVTLAVTPVNTRIMRVTADVTQVFTGGLLSAMTVQCGNSAGGTQYLLANSVFTAQNTWGDVQGEMGVALIGATSANVADFGTSSAGVPGAITVQCRFTCTGANCSAATQGSVTFYVEGVTY